ncbi:MAG TPA: glycosyltransferase [Opitutus sp.]|nr:glycosyltransferase [Opitutus sp.]
MIYFDVTKARSVKHRSGLARLSDRLRRELGSFASAATWEEARVHASAQDWFVTTELFSEGERPGFGAFLDSRRCRTAAIFADAIPLKHPRITWPHSVARHPHYLKMLARFERVWAISAASRTELVDYWRWLGLERPPPVEVLPLGADFDGRPRTATPAPPASRPANLLCVGILEPRKNQLFLLEVCDGLWRAGLKFNLHIVGRINPHFGAPVVRRIRELKKRWSGLHFHEAASDAQLATLYAEADATVFPTIAEGCGLPLLESLWRGVPCVASDLAVLRENADGGGCLLAELDSVEAWTAALRDVIGRTARQARLREEAASRPLPTWAETARILQAGLAQA